MTNITEKINLTVAFTQEQLINELFRQNLALQAHAQALHGTVSILIAQVYQKSDNEAAKLIEDEINKCSERVFKNNEFLIAARKASKK